ncbi:hypothetical protein BGZ94_003184, partial [Podila epigama]
MKKEIEDELREITEGLSNPQYFKETRPLKYDIDAYCLSCGKEASNKDLRREWISVLVPRLKASSLKIFQETAINLEKAWKSQKRERQYEWFEAAEENKMRKLLTKTKYEHRAVVLEHSSSTLARDFQALIGGSNVIDTEQDSIPALHEPLDMSLQDDATSNRNSSTADIETQENTPRNSPLGDASPPSDLRETTTPTHYTQLLLGFDLPSSDPADISFSVEDDIESTTKMYAWNYLEGSGRHDSNVDETWTYNNTEVGRDLMEFRDHVVQENGGLTAPHEKLAVNFIFLVEAEHQTGGLQAEIEDESWDALCEATREQMDLQPEVTIVEAHRWAQLLACETPNSFKALLRESPPKNPVLKSILDKLTSCGQLWCDLPCNEDTYLKAWLGPFLDAYLGNIKYTMSSWTQTQEETRDPDSDVLVPDFATVTVAYKRKLSVVLLEGKVDSNRVFQIWDDKTKLGQELKLSLDSILTLLPSENVSVIGILVREPVNRQSRVVNIRSGALMVRDVYGDPVQGVQS